MYKYIINKYLYKRAHYLGMIVAYFVKVGLHNKFNSHELTNNACLIIPYQYFQVFPAVMIDQSFLL